MDWSQKRKFVYMSGIIGFIVLVAAYPVYTLVHKAPTCFDGRENGLETGTDCGGSCALMCLADVKSPRAIWAKAFPTDARTYDLGVYIENPNTNAGLKVARYTISVLDSAGAKLIEKKGTTELAPSSRVLLFEAGVVFSGTPNSVEVSFDSTDLSKWIRATTEPSPVTTKNQNLKNVETKPRFDAVLVNTDPVNEVKNLTLSAIIYDTSRNPVAISKTFVESIPKGGQENIFFTWPSKLTKHAKGEMCIVPLDTVLMIDKSSYMNIGDKTPVEPFETAKNAALSYVSFMNSSDKVGLVSFFDVATSTVDYELSSDRTAAKEAISALAYTAPKKGTIQNINLSDALSTAVDELQSERHSPGVKQAIVMFANGNTTRPLDPIDPKNNTFAQDQAASIAASARKSGINIYSIGMGRSINETYLRDKIAGGTSHYFSTSTTDILQTIHGLASQVICPQENFITEIIVTPRAIFSE